VDEGLKILNYSLLFLVVLAGLFRFRRLNRAFRIIVLLTGITLCVEISAGILFVRQMYVAKNVVYHLFSVVELTLTTFVFLLMNEPPHYKKAMIASAILWPLLGAANTHFLQPFSGLNTNMVLLESFAIITMSLFSIYRMLTSAPRQRLFLNPYFRICMIWTAQWSSTFFFWAFIKVLYNNHWTYMGLALNLNTTVNFVANAAVGATLLFYPKNSTAFENH